MSQRWLTPVILLGVLGQLAGCEQAKEPVLRDAAQEAKGETVKKEARQAQFKMPGTK